ncbi:ribonuclease 3-like protein 1 isoform X2 [Eutrema salsugineum]|uniref:ribonuclease 3-like protein 1 isoform X2 n=1 Tax=Eutrema salsugineum TaxID=72664 RepID=UPI000CED2507|nr:ribonuclease 3-like protein 1 isoform X2 [Eutrema salsugineum]
MYLPPLDPSSSIPSSSSEPPKPRMMIQRCENGLKLRKLNDYVEEGKALQIESNIVHAQENKLVLSQPPRAGLVPHTTNPISEGTQKVSAKEQLYKLCGVRHWKAPVYECDGPCDMKLFTVKATVEIKVDSGITVLECFGEPHNKKKIASEQAAEAALWFLKNVGLTLQTEEASGRRRKTKPLQ